MHAFALKDQPRRGWLRAGIPDPESVAAHSWGVAWLALVLCPPGVDRGRALALAVVHDAGEAITGDVTPHDGVAPDVKRADERRALEELLRSCPSAAELVALWDEYAAGTSPAARFVRACDKLDMALQAAAYRDRARGSLDEFTDSALAALDPGLLRELAGAS